MFVLFWGGIAYNWVVSLSLSSMKEGGLMYMKGDLGWLVLFFSRFLFAF